MEKTEVIEKLKEVLTQPDIPPTTGILHSVRMMGDDYEDIDINLVLIADQEKISMQEEMQIYHPVAHLELESGLIIECKVWARPWWESMREYAPYNKIIETGKILWRSGKALMSA